MPNENICANCRFWKKWPEQPPAPPGRPVALRGDCTIRAPHLINVQSEKPGTKFPSTRAHEGCGEHEPADGR